MPRGLVFGLLIGACFALNSRSQTSELPELAEPALPLGFPAVESAWRRISKDLLDPEANGWLGMLVQAYDQLETAEICYRRAHTLQSSDRRWAYYLASVQVLLKKHAEAARSLRKALEIEPHYLPAACSS
jgi:tetratricopeptide (TPR) repeat protein